MSGDPYKNFLSNVRNKRKDKFKGMEAEGYIFGEVLHFDNEKGMGMAEGGDGTRYLLHYKNMDRIRYKILSKGQKIHFKPGRYKSSIVATDVAIVY